MPYCNLGKCEAPPCSGASCGDSATCCGDECCDEGPIGCLMMAGVWCSGCTDPVAGTCPLVYSVVAASIQPVPILSTNRAPVKHHHVVRVRLATGRTLEISAPHPTADGRSFGDLSVGSELDGVKVVSREIIPYAHAYTYDILPASSSGSYFAAGVEIGSTLASEGF